MKSDSILLLCKVNDWLPLIAEFLEHNFENYHIIQANTREMPPEIEWFEGEVDWLISFCCQWVIPPRFLEKAKKGAINFHPGPPKYPGTGCYNFAIYNQEGEYGVTCHFMGESVDSGPIIKALTFPIPPKINIVTLKHMSMTYLVTLFYLILDNILVDKPLEPNGLKWSREAYTREDLQALCEGSCFLDFETFFEYDIERWLRATYFPNAPDGPNLMINGKKWRLFPE